MSQLSKWTPWSSPRTHPRLAIIRSATFSIYSSSNNMISVCRQQTQTRQQRTKSALCLTKQRAAMPPFPSPPIYSIKRRAKSRETRNQAPEMATSNTIIRSSDVSWWSRRTSWQLRRSTTVWGRIRPSGSTTCLRDPYSALRNARGGSERPTQSISCSV